MPAPRPPSPEPVWPVGYKRGLEQWESYASQRLQGTPDSCLKMELAGFCSWEVGHLSLWTFPNTGIGGDLVGVEDILEALQRNLKIWTLFSGILRPPLPLCEPVPHL